MSNPRAWVCYPWWFSNDTTVASASGACEEINLKTSGNNFDEDNYYAFW